MRQVELVDAALHLIATRGIAALTTRKLAEAVGLTTGAIFRHFATLDALLEAVVVRVEAVLAGTYPSSELPPLERLERFVEARSTAVGQHLGILRLVLSEQFLLALPDQGSARLTSCVEQTRAFVTACVREAQRDGSVRNDLPAEALSAVVLGTTQLLALAGANPGLQGADSRAVARALSLLLRPMQAEASPSPRGPAKKPRIRAPKKVR